jgi:hypothetical protein
LPTASMSLMRNYSLTALDRTHVAAILENIKFPN